MAHDAPQATGPSKLVIRNIGLILSGALEKPILDGDTIVAENGKITAIGRFKDVNTEGATVVPLALTMVVAPSVLTSLARPMAVILPFSATIVSASRIGFSRAPDSNRPMLRITSLLGPVAWGASCAMEGFLVLNCNARDLGQP